MTSLCITMPSSQHEACSSQCRTLKSMRAALSGIAIVTPEWISRSLEKKEIQLPKGNLCIRTLPSKAERWMVKENCSMQNLCKTTARFGVARYAARLKLRECSPCPSLLELPLQGAYICLCGSWKKGGLTPKKADAQTILHEAGAQAVPATSLMRQLKDTFKPSSESEESRFFVLLCDDAKTDKDSGISTTLFDEISSSLNSLQSSGLKTKVLVVGSAWLFDCVSCGTTIVDVRSYSPDSPRAKELWKKIVNVPP